MPYCIRGISGTRGSVLCMVVVDNIAIELRSKRMDIRDKTEMNPELAKALDPSHSRIPGYQRGG